MVSTKNNFHTKKKKGENQTSSSSSLSCSPSNTNTNNNNGEKSENDQEKEDLYNNLNRQGLAEEEQEEEDEEEKEQDQLEIETSATTAVSNGLSPSNNELLVCKICNKLFDNLHRLQRHMMCHDMNPDLRKFKCEYCNKAFKFKHHLKVDFCLFVPLSPLFVECFDVVVFVFYKEKFGLKVLKHSILLLWIIMDFL